MLPLLSKIPPSAPGLCSSGFIGTINSVCECGRIKESLLFGWGLQWLIWGQHEGWRTPEKLCKWGSITHGCCLSCCVWSCIVAGTQGATLHALLGETLRQEQTLSSAAGVHGFPSCNVVTVCPCVWPVRTDPSYTEKNGGNRTRLQEIQFWVITICMDRMRHINCLISQTVAHCA